MKKTVAFLCFIILIINVSAQRNVYQLPVETPNVISMDAFYYMLPQTTFKVDITVTKVREIKGYYAEYAEKMLGLTNIISNNKIFYKLKEITLTPITIPDKNQLYVVNLSSDQIKNNFLTSLYNHDNGMTMQDYAFEPSFSVMVTPIPDFFKNYANITYTETEDSFVETKIINGVVTQVPANRTKVVSKSTEQNVQEAADKIVKIRKDRYDVAAGSQEVAYSKEAIEAMIKELNQWERNYLDLFTGIILEDEIHYTTYITPGSSSDQQIPLFSINQGTGLSYQTDPSSNDPIYYLSIHSQINHDAYNDIVANKKENPKTSLNGYRIRKTLPAQLSLLLNNQPIHTFGIYSIFQLGKIETLPTNQDKLEISKFSYIY
ncbi:MAG: DUF4831 family protein [Bacteroidales bacterium]